MGKDDTTNSTGGWKNWIAETFDGDYSLDEYINISKWIVHTQ